MAAQICLPACGAGDSREVRGCLGTESASPVSVLLHKWRSGDSSALDRLLPLVYDELRQIARHYLKSERANHTLQCTALVHEAYLRLSGQDSLHVENRAHFFGIAARLMRQVLVDHARERRAAKRAGGNQLTLEAFALLPKARELDVVALDDALNELARLDERQARIVELRFFAGLSNEDTSQVLNISVATVKRSWTTARLWLHRELTRPDR